MIILDTSPVFHSAVAVTARNQLGSSIELPFLRHLFLNQIRGYRKKFVKDYGELVMALDSRKGYWRKDVFPHYKALRKEAREQSFIDWKTVFGHFDTLIQEMRDYFPYKLVYVDRAEADDIISVLSKTAGKHIIVSNDKDFRQLHNKNVCQYFPRDQHTEHEKYPDVYLFEQICHGDKVDGIPNIRSEADCFVSKKRQKPCTDKFVQTLLRNQNQLEEILTPEELSRFRENERIIDLSFVPKEIQSEIIEAYETAPTRGRGKLFEFFASRELQELCDRIGDF